MRKTVMDVRSPSDDLRSMFFALVRGSGSFAPGIDVDLQLEHLGHKLEVKGSGSEFRALFPSFFSLIHYAISLWPLRKMVPEGWVIRLECGWFRYRYRC
jgi:hypothetical protein